MDWGEYHKYYSNDDDFIEEENYNDENIFIRGDTSRETVTDAIQANGSEKPKRIWCFNFSAIFVSVCLISIIIVILIYLFL